MHLHFKQGGERSYLYALRCPTAMPHEEQLTGSMFSSSPAAEAKQSAYSVCVTSTAVNYLVQPFITYHAYWTRAPAFALACANAIRANGPEFWKIPDGRRVSCFWLTGETFGEGPI